MTDTPRIEDLKRRVQLDPASIAFAALAEEYRRAGRFDEAIAVCNTGLVRHPSYLSARVTLGRALIEVSLFDEARTELEFVLKLAPENLAAIRGLAEIHHRRGEAMHEQYAADAANYGITGVETATETAPPPEVQPAPADSPSPAPSFAETTPPPIAIAAAPPVPAPPRVDPALAGLESFLSAIVRARAERAALR